VHLFDVAALGILQVLIRLIGADETIYSNYADTMQWLENTDVLGMIADKFSSSVSQASLNSYKYREMHLFAYICLYLLMHDCIQTYILFEKPSTSVVLRYFTYMNISP
jgi:hypothetical protein